ncbi:MAG: hypothetical protein AB1604_07250, partial [Euryarchaeota archaeon]
IYSHLILIFNHVNFELESIKIQKIIFSKFFSKVPTPLNFTTPSFKAYPKEKFKSIKKNHHFLKIGLI